MSNHLEMIEALRSLYACKPLRDAVTLEFHVGSEETNTPFLRAGLRVAHGYDGKSAELAFMDAATFPKEKNTIGGEGDAVAVMDDDGAMMVGCALIAFVLAKRGGQE